jgi:hypothetical protein
VARQEVGSFPRTRLSGGRHVDHDVTDKLSRGLHALVLEVGERDLRGAQQHRAEVIGQDAVHLLRHRPVERPHTGFYVGDRHTLLDGRQRTGERRVGVAVDQHAVGRGIADDGLKRRQHPRCL